MVAIATTEQTLPVFPEFDRLKPFDGREYCLDTINTYQASNLPPIRQLEYEGKIDPTTRDLLDYFTEEADIVTSLALTRIYEHPAQVRAEELEKTQFGSIIHWFAMISARLEIEFPNSKPRLADLSITDEFPKAIDALINLYMPNIWSMRREDAEDAIRNEKTDGQSANLGSSAVASTTMVLQTA